MSSLNKNIENIINQKRSIYFNKNSETNKVLKYIGGDSIVYRDIYVQNPENNYFGKINQVGNTLNIDSEKINFAAVDITFFCNVHIVGDLSISGQTVTGGGSGSVNIPDNLYITFNGTFGQNLSASGLFISNNALLGKDLVVSGNATFNTLNASNILINGNPITVNTTTVFTSLITVSGLNVSNNAVLNGLLAVSGNSTFSQLVSASGLFISNNAILRGNLIVSGNSTFSQLVSASGLLVSNNAFLNGLLSVSNNSTFNQLVSASGLFISNNAILRGNLIVSSNSTFGQLVSASGLFISNNAVLNGLLSVSSNSTFGQLISASGLSISNNAVLNGLLAVSGNSTFNQLVSASGLFISNNGILRGNLIVSSNSTFGQLVSASGLLVSNNAVLNGLLSVSSNSTFNQLVSASGLLVSNNAVLNGLLSVSGNSTFSQLVSASGLLVSNNAVLNGLLSVSGNSTFSQLVSASGLLISNNAVLNGLLSVSNNSTFNQLVSASGLLVSNNAILRGNLVVSSNSTFGQLVSASGLLVSNNAVLNGLLIVSGNSTFNQLVSASGLLVSNNAVLNGLLSVSNNSTFGQLVSTSGLFISNNAVLNGLLSVSNNSTFSQLVSASGLLVSNNAVLNGLLSVSSNSTFGQLVSASGLLVSNNAVLNGLLSVSSNSTFGQLVSASGLFISHNGSIRGNFNVVGTATFNSIDTASLLVNGVPITTNTTTVYTTLITISALNVSNNATFNGDLKVSGNSTFSQLISVSGLLVSNNAVLNGSLTVSNNSIFGQVISASGLTVSYNATFNSLNTSILLVNGVQVITDTTTVYTTLITISALNVSNNATFNGFLTVSGNSTFSQLVSASGLLVSNNAVLNGLLSVSGNSTFGQLLSASGLLVSNNAVLNGLLSVSGNSTFNQLVSASGLFISNNAFLNGLLSVSGNSTFNQLVSASGLFISNNAVLNGLLSVSGNSTFGQLLSASGLFISNNAVLNSLLSVSGNSTFGQLVSASGLLVSNNAVLNGLLSVSGNSTFSQLLSASGLFISNNAVLNGLLAVSGNSTFSQLVSASGIQVSQNASVSGNLTTNQLITDNIRSNSNTLNIGNNNETSVINIGCGSGIQIVNIGSNTSTGNTTINIGGVSDIVYIAGTLTYISTTNLQVTDNVITLNKSGSNYIGSGIEIESNGAIAAYVKADNSSGFEFSNNGNTFSISQSSHNPVSLGTTNGLSINNQVLSLGLASGSTNGALSSTDWNTFNNKQNTIGVSNINNNVLLTNNSGTLSANVNPESTISFTGANLQNLSVSGNTLLDGPALITKDTTFSQLVSASGLSISNNTVLNGLLNVSSNATFSEQVSTSGLVVSNNTVLNGLLSVSSNATFSQLVSASGLSVSNNGIVNGTLIVSGNATFGQLVALSGLYVSNNGIINGNCIIGTEFSITFSFINDIQTYSIPNGTDYIYFELYGAQGRSIQFAGIGGLGAKTSGYLSVSPGQNLYIYVGGQIGYNGGGGGTVGGGGATDIRIGGTGLSHRVIVAGGGGGAASTAAGGPGGGLTGGNGVGVNQFYNGGNGGTQTSGGLGGIAFDNINNGLSGSLGIGGNGGAGFGGGGGGGGYYGGGGGSELASGGGGSSYVDPLVTYSTILSQGVNYGDGFVIIRYQTSLNVKSDSKFDDKISVSGLLVSNNALINGSLTVSSDAKFSQLLSASGLFISNNTVLNGLLSVSSNATFSQQVSASGLLVSNNIVISGNLLVSGNATFNAINASFIYLNGIAIGTGSSGTNIPDNLYITFNGTFGQHLSTSGLFVSNNAVINGSLIVSGNTTFNNLLSASGLLVSNNAVINGNLTVSGVGQSIICNGGTGAASLELGGDAGAYIDLKRPFSDDYDMRISTLENNGGVIDIAGTGSLNLRTGGIDRLTVSANGNVGIGKTNPLNKLEILGRIRIDALNNTDTASVIEMRNFAGNSNYFFNDANGNFILDPVGNVGIDMTPTEKLSVAGNILVNTNNASVIINGVAGTGSMEIGGNNGAYIDLKRPFSDDYDMRIHSLNNNGGVIDIAGTGTFAIRTGGTDRIIVSANGNVGIGTTNPQALLELNATNAQLAINGESGIGRLEIGGNSGGLIDIKGPFSDDYDMRIGVFDGTNALIDMAGTGSFSVRTGGSDRITITANGNVGIGITNPSSKLQISGNTLISSNNFTIDNSNAVGDVSIDLKYGKPGVGYNRGSINFYSVPSDSIPQFRIIGDNASNGTNDLQFVSKNGSSVMTMVQNGNVGIGTTNPSTRLDIKGGNINDENKLITVGTDINTSTIDTLMGGIRFTNEETEVGSIRSYINVSGNNNGDLRFYTRQDFNNYIERMRIDRFGNVGIGNTSPSYLLTLGNSSGTIGQIGLLPGNNSSFWLLRNNGGNFNIFQPGANLDRITINGTGDVGIGTSNPATRLEVNGSLTPLGAIIINKPQGVLNDGQRYLGFRVQGSDTWNIGINENPSGSGTDGCDLHFYSYTNLSQFIKSVLILKRDGNVIVASGNLGIGTVNPNHQLQIARGGGNSSTLAFVVSESTNDAFIGMNSRALSGDYSSLTKAGDSIIAQGQLNTGGLVLASHGQSSMRLGSQISFSNMPVHINIPYTAWNYFIYTKDAEQVLLAVPTNVLNGAGYATGNSLNYSYGTTRFYIAEARTYRFTYIFFKQNNLGIARFVLTQPSGAVSNYDMDLYAPTTSKITESFTWPVPLEAGTHQLEFRNIGKNASSGAYYLIGIDAVKISPV